MTRPRTTRPTGRGWATLAVLLVACHGPTAFETGPQKVALGAALQRAVARSLEAEKSAVLATTDAESEAFAAESRQASGEVDRIRAELRELLSKHGSADELARLTAFDAAWAKVAAIDARILPLAVANTNLKAAALSANDGAKAVDRLVDALDRAAADSRDPQVLRRTASVSIAALRIQTLEAPHIAAADEAVMSAIEERAKQLQGSVDEALAQLRTKAPATVKPHLDEAEAAWRDDRRITAEIFRLSRENTNVISFQLSTHEKRDVTGPCETALAALVTELQKRPPQPTR